MKVFEARTLINSMENRARQYQELYEKLEHLKKKCQDVVNLDEHLKGKGASSIKGFYQGQMDVIEAWINFVNKQMVFLRGIEGTIRDRDLSEDTVIHISFLEDDLPYGNNVAEESILSHHIYLEKVFCRIDDLVELEAFSKDRFEERMDRTEQHRRETIIALDNLDNELMTEYSLSEDHEQFVTSLFRQLQAASHQGSKISPISFNSVAYQLNEVYKLINQFEQQTKEYLSYKTEQLKFREELHKQGKHR